MPTGDARKEFIFAAAGSYFGLSSGDEAIVSQQNTPALNTFLDDGGASVLAAYLDGRKIILSNTVRYSANLSCCLCIMLNFILNFRLTYCQDCI